eukprot:TRINITY_DN691_c0_g1_i1.p1 TRINITY_DN691_c0_g1~~TRINITY_DN691_c0_g1_i1.p1  ORF type:complete len:855 (+),score=279.07 TRINITY_DN691_c0_g1_i1:214-2778(+)
MARFIFLILPFLIKANSNSCAVPGTAPAGMPRYTAPYPPMVRPTFPPRPPGAMGMMPRPPMQGVRGMTPPIRFPPGAAPDPAVKGTTPIFPLAEKPQTTVYVGKIAPTVDNEFLLSILELCGPIKSWKRAQDPTNGMPKGFGFCEFESADGVLRALRLLNKFNLEGSELVLNVNQATREYLERYVAKMVEKEKAIKESELQDSKEEEAAPGVEKPEPQKPSPPAVQTNDNSTSGDKDNGKTFGIVNKADQEADDNALKKLNSILEERAKNRPPPPAAPTQVKSDSDAPGKSLSNSEAAAGSKDADSDVEIVKSDIHDDKNDDDTTSENKPVSEHEKAETSSSDWGRHHDRNRDRESRERHRDMGRDKGRESRDRDRDRDRDRVRDRESRERSLKREERELERYERERERERLRRERERERRIREAERLYDEREREWESREREKERMRQHEKEREKERERERRRLIKEQEQESDDEEWRKRRHRSSMIEENRKRRQREKEDDLYDSRKEEEEIAEAKRRKREESIQAEENAKVSEKKQSYIANSVKFPEDGKGEMCRNSASDAGEILEQATLSLRDGDAGMSKDDISTDQVSAPDLRHNSAIPAQKVGFGLVGSGKRAVVPSVFGSEDDDDSHKDKKLRPLVPLDYTAEEMQAVSSTTSALTNFTVADSTKRTSAQGVKEDRTETERDRSKKLSDRSAQKEKESNQEEAGSRGRDWGRDRGHDNYHEREDGLENPKPIENKKLMDAKQLIDTIPKTREALFAYSINWDVYDKHNLHERMRPWISKKITEFLGEEEKSLVDFVVNKTRKHVTAAHMLEILESILDEEAEMFVLKMWRMLIFEIKKVESGLASKTRS